MRRLSISTIAIAIVLQAGARAQGPAAAAALNQSLAKLQASVAAVPPGFSIRERLQPAVQWLVNHRADTNAGDVSAEYIRSLERAADVIGEAVAKRDPAAKALEDVAADLEAKVEHCRKSGVGMGGQVNLVVNTVRSGTTVRDWNVRALLKFYEHVKGAEPRAFLRASSPTAMLVEPGRYWVWALDPGTGRVGQRVLVTVAGQKELLLDLPVP